MKKIILASLAIALSACGGSSGGSSDDFISGVNLQVSENSSSNDSISEAQSVSVGSSISGSSSIDDEFDYYEFPLVEGQSVKINLAGSSDSDLDIAVLSSDDNTIARSINDDSNEELSFTASYSGSYFVFVEFYDGDPASYQLTIVNVAASEISQAILATETAFCVESIEDGESEYTIASVESPSLSAISGSCPTAGFISRCAVTFTSSDNITNTYFTQKYVDTVGGHTRVEQNVCDEFDTVQSSSTYSIY